MVLDRCFATGATAKACLLEQKHGWFAGCEEDSRYVAKTMPSLWHVFSLRVLTKDLDFNEADVQCPAEAYLEAIQYEKSGRRSEAWRAPKGPPSVQEFPRHKTQ